MVVRIKYVDELNTLFGYAKTLSFIILLSFSDPEKAAVPFKFKSINN